MNVVDYVLIGIVVVSVLFGLYRGFITSLLGLLAVFAAMFAAYALGPVLTEAILESETIVKTLAHYSDAASRLGDLETSQLAVAGLDASTISYVVQKAQLPAPFDTLLQNNLLEKVFAAAGSVTVSDYLNQTMIGGIVSVICYVLIFLSAYLALSLVVSLIGYVFRFPALKHLDALFGGVFGIARGIFVAYVIFALVPVVLLILPFPELTEWIEASRFGSILYRSNIVTTILNGSL